MYMLGCLLRISEMLILGKQIFPTSPECSNASHTAIGTETETEASTGYMYECSSHLPACHPISSKSHKQKQKASTKAASHSPPSQKSIKICSRWFSMEFLADDERSLNFSDRANSDLLLRGRHPLAWAAVLVLDDSIKICVSPKSKCC